ncbi:HU family DNA-binding protein [candidate division WOR-3 bacterium]|nr:HU family DNA-binding protein [candidate division WOR-3 bacterium]
MTKAELIDKIAKSASVTKKAAGIAVDTMIDEITKALKKGQRVPLVGFGTFMVRRTKARKGRNPRTGEEIKIKAGKRAVFKPGKGLREAIA